MNIPKKNNIKPRRMRPSGSRPFNPAMLSQQDPQMRNKDSQAHKMFNKYLLLAEESLSQGNRVEAESHFQHADHYLRILNEQDKARLRFASILRPSTPESENIANSLAPSLERPETTQSVEPEQQRGASGDLFI